MSYFEKFVGKSEQLLGSALFFFCKKLIICAYEIVNTLENISYFLLLFYRYEKSYMHRDVVTHVAVSAADFFITGSADGKFKALFLFFVKQLLIFFTVFHVCP